MSSVSIVPNIAGSDTHTKPVAYSPTLSNTGGVSGSTFFWRQEGKYMVIDGQILFNDAGSSTPLTITLPTAGSPVIDTSVLPGGTGTANATASLLGAGAYFNTGDGWFILFPKYVSTTTVGFWTGTQAFANDLAENGSSLNFTICVPIVGW